ncbi:hypothetical protein WN51_01766 [Melipona quadrifasciata]|uniref:Mos1 transposase HTH domain-containing protein n=1 Tax=Melipona quadrifasciata TaxID=166423 RepID=A0A0N0U4Z7_9HYME|nr:hypothetical protein WN51_01766 [Melipona quadrifasciata]
MESQKGTFSLYSGVTSSKRKKTVQAHKKLCDVYGKEALKLRQYQNWFAKYHC